MTDKLTYVDRLRKLLALASSPNAHEAEVARKAAERFMWKHGLTEDDVKQADDDAYYELSMGIRGWNATWRFVLVTQAARHHGAEVIALQKGPRRLVKICGPRAAVKRAEAFYHRLEEVVRQMEAEVARRHGHELACYGFGLTAREISDAFRRGVVLGLAVRLEGYRRKPGGTVDGEKGSPPPTEVGSDSPPLREGRTDSNPEPECRALVRVSSLVRSPVADANTFKEKYSPTKKPIDLAGESDPALFEIGYRYTLQRVEVDEGGDVVVRPNEGRAGK